MDSEGNHGHGAYTKLRPDGDMEFHGFVIPNLRVGEGFHGQPAHPTYGCRTIEDMYGEKVVHEAMKKLRLKENRR